LDHMPEQFPLDGIAYGQRWVSTPACRAARAVSEAPLDSIHYMTLYLMTEPVERTLAEFRQLGRDLRAVGRFHLHRRARLSGPFVLCDAAVAPRVLISAEAVPYRPNLGVFVEVEERPDGDDSAGQEQIRGAHLPALCAQPGVAGAWSFADEQRRVTVTWLDAPPRDMSDRLAPIVARRRESATGRTVFAGSLETITPWQWTWFDAADPE
ncbi:MAG: hypothetical protein QOC79_2196, partial [Actinomycetota bacterium]|nr:hypothetical protein [Actinomycetota bacterium]